MDELVLLEIEEDIRLAAKIVARKHGINLRVYADYSRYAKEEQECDIICSSDMVECMQHKFYYIKKPYTAHQLLELIRKVR